MEGGNSSAAIVVGANSNQSLAAASLSASALLAWAASGLTIFALGALANAVTAASIARQCNTRMHTPAYAMVALLACNDAVLCCLIVVQIAHVLLFGLYGWRLNEIYCRVYRLPYTTGMYASIVGQMLIALNRCTAVLAPILYRRMFTIRSACILFSLGAWLFTAVYLSMASLAIWGGWRQIDAIGTCTFDPYTEHFHLWITVTFSVFIYFPAALTAFCNVLIVWRILATRNSSAATQRATRRRARGTAMMFACYCAYLIGYIPPAMTQERAFREPLYHIWVFVGLWCLNFAVNPVFYALLNTELRAAMSATIQALLPPALQSASCFSASPQNTNSNSYEQEPPQPDVATQQQPPTHCLVQLHPIAAPPATHHDTPPESEDDEDGRVVLQRSTEKRLHIISPLDDSTISYSLTG